jgi:hypothetical protein
MRLSYPFAAAMALGILAMTPAAQAQAPKSTQGAYCHEGTTGTKNCTFATLAACQNLAKSQGGRCAKNTADTGMTGSAPRGSTSGSGGMGSGTK